jgi:hypothetical protein
MRSLPFTLVMLAIAGSCAETNGRPAERPETAEPATRVVEDPPSSDFTWLMLHDIQGLYGGRALYIRPDGSVIVQVVESREPDGLEDARYEGALDAGARTRIVEALTAADFRNLDVPDRLGVPDEARAVLVVRYADGVVHRAAKWQDDEHAEFVRITTVVMEVARMITASSAPMRVPFDWEWRPSGVDWPPLR